MSSNTCLEELTIQLDHSDRRLATARAEYERVSTVAASNKKQDDVIHGMRMKLSQQQQRIVNLERVNNLFHKVFYSCRSPDFKKHELKQTREEMVMTLLELSEATAAVYALEEELANATAEKTAAELENEWIFAEKRDSLIESRQEPIASSIAACRNEVSTLTNEITAQEEIVAIGNRALFALRQSQSQLRSAANWGTYDLWRGGKMSAMIKNNKILSAKQAAQRAQWHLRQLQTDCPEFQASLEGMAVGFTAFADVWMDSFVVGLHVQQRINRAESICGLAIRKVSEVVANSNDQLVMAIGHRELCEWKARALVASYGQK